MRGIITIVRAETVIVALVVKIILLRRNNEQR